MPGPQRPHANQPSTLSPRAVHGPRRWLLFVHQLPSTPSNLRVRTWRRLQQLGAIPIKQAVYVLPDSASAREDFEWLKTEIKDAGGDATVFAAEHVDAWSDDALIDEFRRSRQEAYAALAHDIERVVRRLSGTRRPRRSRAPAGHRLLEVFRHRFTAIEGVDFFGSAGRDRVMSVLNEMDDRVSDKKRLSVRSRPSEMTDADRYHGRLWVTRPRPGVDRMASAWLIHRFIDMQARFDFVADRDAATRDAVPFDMFGVEFSHQGDHCTFETLCEVFSIHEVSVGRLAAIVHDLDLKDARFGAPEASTVGAIIEGLQLAHPNDDELLAHGMTLFDALYRTFEHSARSAGPRPLARPRRASSRSRR